MLERAQGAASPEHIGFSSPSVSTVRTSLPAAPVHGTPPGLWPEPRCSCPYTSVTWCANPRWKPAREAIQRGLNPPLRQWGARCFRVSTRFRHRCRMRFASSHRARLGISGRGKGGSRLMPCPLRSSWEGCLQFVNRRKGLAPSERDRGISLAQQNLMRASP